ncbi:hypothetical protein G7B40_001595 [Aetokthonos hydrillicola Thurmond2011]|jgi:hypothetical protein|uniref:WDGH domain-containing protein n=1 Tax=Aetokthonos hydrillicola Thurmond2011 TaxID=2712845 RepID=A0AAP5I6B9_9CYAN|nr:hypothetical protein [Aetokthonos hydrillicola]MBO3463577.1 hypothetical protein [Aetokthonos hydrillicola CCALA 1050]MDR9893280.1 hypothetical protein [Aetokthonos hydrillicola Thurmond2011]
MYDFKEEIGKKFYEAQNTLPNTGSVPLPLPWNDLSEEWKGFYRQAGAIVAQAVDDGKLPDRLLAAVTEKNQAYVERNKVLALATKLAFLQGYAVELWEHPADDKEWETEWRNIVAIQLPSGWLTWHIHIEEMPLFNWIKREQNKWDGHTTPEKYKRLEVFVMTTTNIEEIE